MSTIRIVHPTLASGLEGRAAHAGELAAVAAPPHPLYGGSFDSPVIEALERGLARRGIATLAFNWRGVGTSDGRKSGRIEDGVEDYRAAVAHVASGRAATAGIVASGYSFGAVAALAVGASDPRVSEIILVAPPIAMLPAELFTAIPHAPRVTVIAAERDDLAPLREAERFASATAARLVIVADADHFFSSSGFERIESSAADGTAVE